MNLEELASKFVKEFEDDPLLFHKESFDISLDDLEILEEMLLSRIPNLIITHSDSDTREDIERQVDRIMQILDSDEAPYFIDFSYKGKEYVKRIN